jgi:hypothetical protein
VNYSQEFAQYLDIFRDRLRRLTSWRGIAALATVALAVTLVAVAIANLIGFPGDFMWAARMVLVTVLAATAWIFLGLPRRRLQRDSAKAIEARAPEFSGRVETFIGGTDSDNPMRELLAEESLGIASRQLPNVRVPDKEFHLQWSLAVIATVVLLLLAIAGPGNWAYGVRDLWVGWALPGLLPPQSLEVIPGDSGIRLNANLRIEAAPRGFNPVGATLHARFAGGDWQQVDMTQQPDGFEFTFFAVRQNLEYYVATPNVRSPNFSVQVVDLPVIENLALTYRYPDWAGKDPEIHDPGGDIRTIADTAVQVAITADRALPASELIVDGESFKLDIEDNVGRAEFTVGQDGQYYIAARVGSERIRLTDDYFITLKDDEAPQVEFARPGKDWSASRIEEVTTAIDAKDDFRIERLSLHYSVNGGDWQEVELDTSQTEPVEHVFSLESISSEGAPLKPGDLVAYYSAAKDRNATSRTDIFFVDVQPFDRRYSQSQMAGGMAGQQGGQQNEISQRQREIIISTWNLIREQGLPGGELAVSDNAALLARVQNTLKEQVETLARRSEARELTVADDEIARFVEHLNKAAEAMVPAADELTELDLEAALLPEQAALQHLLAAEAVFTDINVSLQANRNGQGGQAGRDLAEMFELEMDLEKNQYETGSRATPEAPQQSLQEASDELKELARRQEQLARNQQRGQTPLPEQRWQQEMLRREVEELQRRLEELTQDGSQPSAQTGSAGSAQGESAGGNAEPTPGAQGEVAQLRRRLDSALRAMDEANAAEASRQLEGARASAEQAGQEALQSTVESMAEQATQLHETQAGIESRLQEAVRRVLNDKERRERFDSGLDSREEYEIAAQKRDVLAQLQQLQQAARRTAQTMPENQAPVAETLRGAVQELREREVEARLSIAAAYIEHGEAVYVVSSESAVTEALREFSETLGDASRALANSERGVIGRGDALEQTLARVQQLRQELQRAAQANERGSVPGGEQTDADLEGRLREAAENLREALRFTPSGPATAGTLEDARRAADRWIDGDPNRNREIIARQARRALSDVEQLELVLGRALKPTAGVRADPDEAVRESHREMVADYYRRLGQAEPKQAP